MDMKSKTPVALVISLVLVNSTSLAFASDVCVAPSVLHEQKMNKYKMPDMPSLLEDCGINSLLEGFGGSLFKSFKVNMPDVGLFCGYTAKDVAGWYGVDVPGHVGGSLGGDYTFGDIQASDLITGDSLFEGSSSQRDNNVDLNLNMD